MNDLVVSQNHDAVPRTRQQHGGALQRAVLAQWQAAGALLVLVGLTLGAYLIGVGAGLWMLALCVVFVAPMLGTAIATRLGRYHLAASSSLLGAGGYAFSALFCLLMAPGQIGDWPTTAQMLTSITECLLVVPPLLVTSWVALEASRALRQVPADPPQLRPGAQQETMLVNDSEGTTPERLTCSTGAPAFAPSQHQLLHDKVRLASAGWL
jgi:hypothetical protein